MDLQTWLGFFAASFLLLIIPGPTVLLVISYAMSQGKRVAVASASGVALGDLVAMTASLAGLGAIVLASAQLFTILKWIGAAYLFYLGIMLFRSAGSAKLGDINDIRALPAKGVFWHAATVTALNPKSIVFFIAFVPQFINPAVGLLPQFVTLIATFVGLAGINALAIALLADLAREKLMRPTVIPWLTRVGGGLLVTMGLAVAASSREAAG